MWFPGFLSLFCSFQTLVKGELLGECSTPLSDLFGYVLARALIQRERSKCMGFVVCNGSCVVIMIGFVFFSFSSIMINYSHYDILFGGPLCAI
jgi:hypothetical protein